jgi:hypothetical protein
MSQSNYKRLADLGFQDIVFTDSRGTIYNPHVDNIEGYCHILITINLEEFNIILPSLYEWLVYMNNYSMPYININFSEFVDVSINPYVVPNWHGVHDDAEHPIHFVFIWRMMLIRNEKDLPTINQEESHSKIKEVLDRYSLKFDMNLFERFQFGLTDEKFEIYSHTSLIGKSNGITFDDVTESVKNQKIEKVLLEFFPEEICQNILQKCSAIHEYKQDYDSYMRTREKFEKPSIYEIGKKLYENDVYNNEKFHSSSFS